MRPLPEVRCSPARRKLSLISSRFFIDIGVVELDVVDDEQFGQVVNKLAALVEKSGVVLVALDDVIRRGALNRAPWPRLLGKPPIM